MNKNPNKTINLYVPGASKTRVIVGEDENGEPKAIYLNLDDQGILNRLYDAYDKLLDYAKEFEKLESLEKGVGEIGDAQAKQYFDDKAKVLKAAEEVIDGVFDYHVVESCSAGGTLFDVLRETGQYRYDAILSSLTSLYTEAIEEGNKALEKKRKAHTKKYTKRDRS